MKHLTKHWDVVALVLGLILAGRPAQAYIDPGTASAVWAVGLAPFLAALAYLGRRLVRMFRRSEQTPQSDQPTAEDDNDSDDATLP